MTRYRLVTRDSNIIRNHEWSSLDDLADNVDSFVAKYGRVEAQRFDPEMRHWYSTGHFFGTVTKQTLSPQPQARTRDEA